MQAKSLLPQSLSAEEISHQLSTESKWLIYAIEREVYLSTINGKETTLLFENVGEEDKNIVRLNVSEDGKSILALLSDEEFFSLWLLKIDSKEQYNIANQLTSSPLQTGISKDGSLAKYSYDSKVWLYRSQTNELVNLGESTYGINMSPDGKKIIFLQREVVRGIRYNFLWKIDVDTNKKMQLSSEVDGIFWNPKFIYDNQTIITPNKTPAERYHSLWYYDYLSRTLTYLAGIEDQNIWLGIQSMQNNVIAFTTGKEFYSIIDYEIILLCGGQHEFASRFSLRISHDGKYLLYSNSDIPQHMAKTDGSFYIETSKLFDDEKLTQVNWYNHPPFPPLLEAKSKENGNLLTWSPPRQGTFDIAGYAIYRSTVPDQPFVLIDTLDNSDILEYLDEYVDPKASYYYYICTVDEMGTESKPSNKVRLDYSSFLPKGALNGNDIKARVSHHPYQRPSFGCDTGGIFSWITL